MLELGDPDAGGGGNPGGPPGAPTGGGVPKAGGGNGASAWVNRIGAVVDDVEDGITVAGRGARPVEGGGGGGGTKADGGYAVPPAGAISGDWVPERTP